MEGNAYVLRPGEGRSIDLGNFLVTVKAEASKTAGFTLLEATEPPNCGRRCTYIAMQLSLLCAGPPRGCRGGEIPNRLLRVDAEAAHRRRVRFLLGVAGMSAFEMALTSQNPKPNLSGPDGTLLELPARPC